MVYRQCAPLVCHLPSKVCSNCKICFWEGFFYCACHNSDMLSRTKTRINMTYTLKTNSCSSSWRQSQILSRWYVHHTSSSITNPNESVILAAITMLGWAKRRNLGLWGMNKWQTEEIWRWITFQALSSEVKTKLISISSLLVTTASLQPNSLAGNPLLPPGVTLCLLGSRNGLGLQYQESQGRCLWPLAEENRGNSSMCTYLCVCILIPAI